MVRCTPIPELTGHRKIALHSRDCAIARYVLHSCHCIARWTALVTVCMALAQAFVMCTFISHTCMLHIFMLLTLDVTYLIPTVVLACCTSLHTACLYTALALAFVKCTFMIHLLECTLPYIVWVHTRSVESSISIPPTRSYRDFSISVEPLAPPGVFGQPG